MSEVEANMLKAIKFKRPVDDFDERQDYLAAIVRKLSGMQEAAAEEAMSKLTDEAYDWYCRAVEHMNVSEDIPDFPDIEVLKTDVDLGIIEPEAEEPEQEEEPDGVDEESDQGIEEPDQGPEEVDTELQTADEDHSGEPETVADGTEDSVENEDSIENIQSLQQTGTETVEREWSPSKTQGTPKRKQSKEVKAEAKAEREAKRKAKKAAKANVGASGGVKAAKPPPPAKKKSKLDRRKLYAEVVPDYKRLSGQKNRYGIIAGTKKDHAIKMFEEGYSMREVERVCGLAFYNMLKDLKKEGHRIQKLDHFVLKLTHADDVAAAKKKAK
jgi:hypothetical protein